MLVDLADAATKATLLAPSYDCNRVFRLDNSLDVYFYWTKSFGVPKEPSTNTFLNKTHCSLFN